MEELHLAPSSGELAYCRIMGRSSVDILKSGGAPVISDTKEPACALCPGWVLKI